MQIHPTIRRLLETAADRYRSDEGFSTAELLGNAALGIIALVAIWGVLQALGVNVVTMIGDAITDGFGG